MIKIKFSVKDGIKNKIKINEYTIPHDFYQENSYGADVKNLNKNEKLISGNGDKKIFFTIDNIENKNIKGNFYIFYSKKISLNSNRFKNGNQQVQTKTISHTIGYQIVEKNNFHLTPSELSFTPVFKQLNVAEYLSKSGVKFKDVYYHKLKYWGEKPTLIDRGIKQYFILSKKYFLYVIKDNKKFSDIKFPFPNYLIQPLEYIKDNFQFFLEYENKTLGNFIDEEVTLYLRMYIK